MNCNIYYCGSCRETMNKVFFANCLCCDNNIIDIITDNLICNKCITQSIYNLSITNKSYSICYECSTKIADINNPIIIMEIHNSLNINKTIEFIKCHNHLMFNKEKLKQLMKDHHNKIDERFSHLIITKANADG